MLPATWQRARIVFEQALDRPADGREAWVRGQCAADEALAAEVLALLRADAEIELPVIDDTPAPRPRDHDLAGTAIAGFQVRRHIGSGGMGTVYEAWQERPQRTVALKVLAVQFPSERARRRFEDEAEILAQLRHPAIAQVLAAGSMRIADADVPWFAMELVEEPRPLDAFVREQRLDVAGVLALFATVLDAVHCAHQHGVIHRDLKPANVLVDRRGQVKLIDFGIARFAGRDAVDRCTRTGEILGTLAYMSPERLERKSRGDETPADIYALGVMLYELLAGRPPFACAGLPPARAMEHLLAADPVPPSRCKGDVPVELDWIVAKAMAREVDRRYASATEFAADIARFRRHEPVAASPPSAIYRLRKLARRHRVLLGVAATAFAAVSTGFVIALVGWQRVAAAEQLARRQAATLKEVNRFQEDVLFDAQGAAYGNDVRLVDAVDRAAAEIDSRSRDHVAELALRRALGNAYLRLGRLPDSERQLLRAEALLAEHPVDPADGWHVLVSEAMAELYEKQGRHELAERHARQALADSITAYGSASETAAVARHNLASLLLGRGSGHAEALDLATRALQAFTGPEREPGEQVIHTRTLVASALAGLRRHDEAQRMFAEALALAGQCLHADHEARLATLGAWAGYLFAQRRFEEALGPHLELAAARERTLGAQHLRTLSAQSSLAAVQGELGRYTDAEATLRRVVAGYEAHDLGSGLDWVKAQQTLVATIRRQGRAAEAEPLARSNRANAERTLPEDHWLRGVVAKEHGACLRELGRWQEAEEALLAGHALLERVIGNADYRTQRVVGELAALYDAWSRPAEAEQWRRKLVSADR